MNAYEEKLAPDAVEAATQATSPAKKLHGFASLTPERRQEIARKGAAAVALKGTRYRFTSEKAREAQRIGWARKNKTAPNT